MTIEGVQGNGSDALVTVVNGQSLLLFFDPYVIARDTGADENAAGAERDPPGGLDSTELASGRIGQCRQLLWARPGARPPMVHRYVHTQGLMGPDGVIGGRSPVVQPLAEQSPTTTVQMGKDFLGQSSMQAFHLSLCLGVIGPAMNGADFQTDQSGVEPAQANLVGIMGPELVVAEQGVRQAYVGEQLPQGIPGRGQTKVATWNQAQ